MPTYEFYNTKENIFEEHVINITKYDSFVKKNPNLERVIGTPPAVTFNGRTFGSLDAGTDNSWKEVLSKIAENNRGTAIDKKYGKKLNSKEVKTNEVLKKHSDIAENNNRKNTK